jgi:hypothetical protein
METIPAFEQSALPVALQKNMGILSMKVMGQGMLVGSGNGRASSAELLQIQFKPARRQRDHRLRANDAARTKYSGCLELHPDERERQRASARKSRAIAFSLGEFSS